METADNMLMRSDPLDVAVAIAISRGTVREMRQKPRLGGGLQLAHAAHRRWRVRAARIRAAAEVGAISMSSSGVTVALNAVARKRLHLPRGS